MTRESLCLECGDVFPKDDMTRMRDRDSAPIAVYPLVCGDCADLDRYASPDSEPAPDDGTSGDPWRPA